MNRQMRILIGCETSGVMRRAFAALGHDVWSNDMLPAEDGSNRHLVGDIRDYLDMGWDMLAVMHPPCTRLCNSGVRWLHQPPPGRSLDDMWQELEAGVDLFNTCLNAPIPRVAVENPVMHGHARERIVNWIKPQIVQPWWFGEPFFKATGFYLRGLPQLQATNKLIPPKAGTDQHKAWSAIHRASPGPDRWRFRSRTFDGIAAACAEQWAGYAEKQAEVQA